jgi:hypothetical protein
MEPDDRERLRVMDERLWYALVLQAIQCALLAAIVLILLFFGHS